MIVTLDGKLTLRQAAAPRVSRRSARKYNPIGLSGEPVRKTLPEDAQLPDGGSTDPTCIDPLQDQPRTTATDVFDRYAVARVPHAVRAATRPGSPRAAYVEQFVRDFEPLQVLAPSPLLPGGLSFKADLTSYRAGGAIDGDVELSPTAARAVRRRGVPRVEARRHHALDPGRRHASPSSSRRTT